MDEQIESVKIIPPIPKITLKEKLSSSLLYWRRNIVEDPEAPLYYSELTIYCFSLFCSTLFGAFLLAWDLRKINKKIEWELIFFGIVYFIFNLVVIDKIKDFGGLTILLFNIIGVYILNRFFWRRYVGVDTKYRAKSILKPLIVAIIVDLVLVYGISMSNSANNQITLENIMRQQNIEVISQIDQVQFAFQAATASGDYGDQNSWKTVLVTVTDSKIKNAELKISLQDSIHKLKTSENKNEVANYITLINLESPLNDKISELANLELSIDWKHPTPEDFTRIQEFIKETNNTIVSINNFRNTLPIR